MLEAEDVSTQLLSCGVTSSHDPYTIEIISPNQLLLPQATFGQLLSQQQDT